MSKVISFINRKGGTGKTTSAINTATALREMGFEVTVMETDNNYSLTEMRERDITATGQGGGKFPELVQTDEASVDRFVRELRKKMVDFIIIDGAANMSPDTIRRVTTLSDIVVVPTSLSDNEMMVTARTLRDIQPVMQNHRKLKVVLLANRIHFLTAQETVGEALAHLGIPVLDIYIPNYKQYTSLNTMTPADCYRQVAKSILKMFVNEPVLATAAATTEEMVAMD